MYVFWFVFVPLLLFWICKPAAVRPDAVRVSSCPHPQCHPPGFMHFPARCCVHTPHVHLAAA